MTVSKAMSFVLRHGAEAEGLKLDENGYANVAELVRKGFFCCWQMHENVFRAQSFSVALLASIDESTSGNFDIRPHSYFST